MTPAPVDLLIRGAKVFDGLGSPGRIADVAVVDGRIVEVGSAQSTARSIVDAAGLALMPGIIDVHTHYDAQITWDPTLSPSPSLGVTTALIGNCGFGIAPCPEPLRETMLKNLSVVEGMDLDALVTGTQWQFETFSEYLDFLRRQRPYLGVRRLTSDLAGKFRIPERGRIAPGAWADLLLFDPATVGLSSLMRVPDLPGGGARMIRTPRGVAGVWVNGVQVFDGGDYVKLERGPGAVLDRFDS